MSQVLLFVHGQISWESAKHVLQALLQRGCQPRIHFLQKNIFIEDSLKDIAQTLQVRREELFNTPWSVMLANDNVYKDPRLGKRLF
jgi:arsenate reductase-like glutaredoxin family protein